MALKKDNILFCGHPRTGQHWILFFIENYHNILMNNAQETISFNELYRLIKTNESSLCMAKNQKYLQGYPCLKWIETGRTKRFERFFDSFDKLIYLHRHPADVMISMYYYYIIPKEFNYSLFEDYVKNNIMKYYDHIEETMPYANVVLSYDDLKKNPNPFHDVLFLFYDNIDEHAFEISLKISSFDNIKKTQKKRHTRNGNSNQYSKIMKKNLIELIKKLAKKRNFYDLWNWD